MSDNLPTRRAALAAAATSGLLPAAAPPDPLAWVRGVTRMGFGTPGEAAALAAMGVQVMHTNACWPYSPLARAGGGLPPGERATLKRLVADCRRHGLRVSLGLPPFMPVALAKEHPEWRERRTPDAKLAPPREDDLGTRAGCNNGPWGDYLIEVCAELAREYDLDGFSFDGNYHPPICHCPACLKGYGKALPRKSDLADIAYREYLVWRGERLVEHYRRLRKRLAEARPGTAVMTWTVNAGRYGHFLHSPRAMPVSLNRVIDLPMQEWWLDETNLGASIAPAFGAAYLRAVAGGPCASEPYLMSRGNPYGTDSFPHHERMTRAFLALTYGNVAAHSMGWPGHRESTREVFAAVKEREPWLTDAEPLPWAGMLVSEQTRQFHSYQDIAGRFLPHPFGAFRAATEGHRPVTLLTDDDITADRLKRFAVVVLPGAAALSERQCAALRGYVRAGGGLVATGDTSLCDEIGRARKDFALADVFGVSYKGRPAAPAKRVELDGNFAVAIDEGYWRERVGLARLKWGKHPLTADEALGRLVPSGDVTFKGPLVAVGEPGPGEVVCRVVPEGWKAAPLPGVVCRVFGKGRVVYLAACLDAALWSYAYPYQRRLFLRAMDWAARARPAVEVTAPLCVHATFWEQAGRRVVHLFNGVNTAAGHGLPSAEVPLREETLPIHGIRVAFRERPKRVTLRPEGKVLAMEGGAVVVPRLDLHAMVVAEG